MPAFTAICDAAPAITVVGCPVLEVIDALVTSDAVTVCVPAVLKVTAKVWVPETKLAFGGKVAAGSLEVIDILSAEETTFQLASTAFTVTLKEVPAVCTVGVPDLPVAVPGAAVTPGINNLNFVNAPAFTIRFELAGPEVVPSEAVIVVVSAFKRFVASVVVETPEVKETLVV